MSKLKSVFLSLIEDILRPVGGPLGIAVRRAYYSRRLKRCGSNLRISTGVYLDGPEYMLFGDWVCLDKNVIITAGALLLDQRTRIIQNPACKAKLGEVILGDRCHIAVNCVIQGHGGVSIGGGFTASAGALIYSMSNCPYGNLDGQVDLPGYPVAKIATPVAIGENVWLGLKSIVIGNAVGDNCFVKPLSLVISNIPPNTIATGVPARPERSRFGHLNRPATREAS